MKIQCLVALATLGLASCASAPKEFTFDRERNALIVLAVPTEAATSLDEFRRVDLKTNRFVDEGYVRIEVTTLGLFGLEPNQINDDSAQRVVALATQEVPPGDYALQQSTRTATNGVYESWGKVCFNNLSPVYSLAAGDIALIRADQVSVSQSTGQLRTPTTDPALLASGNAAVMKEFEAARAKYPGLSGDAKQIQPSALIRWPRADNCALPASFERVAGEMTP
jgi:hypothetical protein